MSTIDLDCPECSARLQIDEAYAGSVCRCDSCGQLMKVPAAPDASQDTGRPTAPGDEPDVVTPAPAEPAEQPAPTRRWLIPAITGAVLLIALAGLAFFATSRPPAQVESQEVQIKDIHGGYHPDQNPYLSRRANFLGVPLLDPVVISIDASATSRRWFDLAKASVMSNLVYMPDDARMRVMFWQEDDVDRELLPVPPRKFIKNSGQANMFIQSDMDRNAAQGDASPMSATLEALKMKPRQIVFVTSQLLDGERLEKFDQALRTAPQLRVDIIVIDQEQPGLQQIAERHNGLYITLPLSRVVTWYQESQP